MTDEEYLKWQKQNCPYCVNNYENCSDDGCNGEYETAQEMFEELGYRKREDSARFIDYFRSSDVVLFDKEELNVEIDEVDIEMPLFKAIQKQLEELEWI